LNGDKKCDRDLDAERKFCRVQIQDRIVVVYTSEMSVLASEVALRKIPFCLFGETGIGGILELSMNLQRANVIRTGFNGDCTFCIPIAEYQALISLSDRSAPEYKKFRNGIIVDQVVHFVFDESTAQRLYKYALANCPPAAKHIQQTMRESADELPF
jgi:hypothetical protein